MYHCFPQNIKYAAVFNKIFFLEQQISILEWFLKDHVTLKTGVVAADNSVLPLANL